MDFKAVTSPTNVEAPLPSETPASKEIAFGFLDASQSIKCLYQQSINSKVPK